MQHGLASAVINFTLGWLLNDLFWLAIKWLLNDLYSGWLLKKKSRKEHSLSATDEKFFS